MRASPQSDLTRRSQIALAIFVLVLISISIFIYFHLSEAYQWLRISDYLAIFEKTKAKANQHIRIYLIVILDVMVFLRIVLMECFYLFNRQKWNVRLAS
jgi:hypothetical protein